jgi:hypothetical protein
MDSDRRLIQGTIIDLSSGGARVRVYVEVPRGTNVRIFTTTPEMQLEGRVVGNTNSWAFDELAVAFEPVAPAPEVSLRALIEQLRVRDAVKQPRRQRDASSV